MKLFGDPLLVKASVDDQVSDIAARIQAKLQAKPEELAAWKWSWHSNLAAPEELQVLIRSSIDALSGQQPVRLPARSGFMLLHDCLEPCTMKDALLVESEGMSCWLSNLPTCLGSAGAD